jgi:hypothetical protein
MALGFLALLAINIGASLVIAGLQSVLRKGAKGDATTIKPPRVEPGAPLPIVFGTVRVAPNVIYYNTDSFAFLSSGRPSLRFSLAGAVCHGVIDELIDITFDDGTRQVQGAETTFPRTRGISTHTRFELVDETGASGGWRALTLNGFEGFVDFYWGLDVQPASSFLQGKLGATNVPTYKGVSYLVFESVWYRLAPQVPTFWVTVRRSPGTLPGMDPDHANIDGDANPAAVIWDILTDVRWGLAVPESAIDDASLAAASAVLYAEGLGVSGLIEHHEEAESVIEDICRHVGGVVQTDPATGLIRFDLIRDDDAADAHELDVSNATFVECTRPSQAELRNVVKITHRAEGASSNTSAERVMDITGVQRMGGQRVEPLDLMLFRSVDSVYWAGSRALRALALPLARLRVRVDRRAAGWRIGTKFLATWADAGLSDTAFRVTAIDWGTLEEGTIEVEAVEEASGGMLAAPEPPECEEVWFSQDPEDNPLYDSGWMSDASLWTIVHRGGMRNGVAFQGPSDGTTTTDDPDVPSLPAIRLGGFHLLVPTTTASSNFAAVVVSGLPPNRFVRIHGWVRTWRGTGYGYIAATAGIGGFSPNEELLDFEPLTNLPEYKATNDTLIEEGELRGHGYSDPDPFILNGWTDSQGDLAVGVHLGARGRGLNHAATWGFYRVVSPQESAECVFDYDLPTDYAAPTIDSVVPQVSGTTLTLTAELSDPTDAIAAGAATIHFQTWNGSAYVDVGTYTQTTATGTAASPSADTYTATITLDEDGTPTEWRVLITYYDATDTEQDGGSVEGSSQASVSYAAVILTNGDYVTDTSNNIFHASV